MKLGSTTISQRKTAVRQWKYVESPPPKKPKTVWSARKVMVSAFWDVKGILLIDYLPTGQTITGQYYENLLDQIQERIHKKKARFVKEKVISAGQRPPAYKCYCHGENP
jgi:Transposase.